MVPFVRNGQRSAGAGPVLRHDSGGKPLSGLLYGVSGTRGRHRKQEWAESRSFIVCQLLLGAC